MKRQGPNCECGECGTVAEPKQPPVMLPPAAWRIAGDADPLGRIAVAPGHHERFVEQGLHVEDRRGWFAVGP